MAECLPSKHEDPGSIASTAQISKEPGCLPVSSVFKRWGRRTRNWRERRLEGEEKVIREDGGEPALMKVIFLSPRHMGKHEPASPKRYQHTEMLETELG